MTICTLMSLLAGCQAADETEPRTVPIQLEKQAPQRANLETANSALWGARGEKWTPQSRLPFFGHAGYRGGGVPLPRVKQVANVRDFGAKGDGATDDSAAILRAVEATKNGALLFPAGRYVLRDTIEISRPNVVLRGEGPDKSVLVMPNSLEELQGSKLSKDNKSNYSFNGGFVRVNGKDEGALISAIAKPAKRGDRVLVLASNGAKIKAGDTIRLRLTDTDHTLGKYLHADVADAGEDTYQSRQGKFVNWAARVAAVADNQITLDRPLRLDARLEWQPEIWSSAPTVREVGIEGLGFEFAGKPKKSHLKEEGFNAIDMRGAVDSWVRDVSTTDADIGVIAGGTRNCTVQNIQFLQARRQGETGHHALWATGGAQDCLFQDFEFKTIYTHDLTVEGFASGNVFRRGVGVAMNFDHHRNAPYENLFTDINVGDARRTWNSSGRADRGPHSGARATFWNIRADKGAFKTLDNGNFPAANVIGLQGLEPKMSDDDNLWIEPLSEAATPLDLYQSQRDFLAAQQSERDLSARLKVRGMSDRDV